MRHTSLFGRLGGAETYKGILMKADRALHEQVAAHLQSRKPPPAKVLDFGAGEGALSLRLSELGYDVTACDMNETDFKCGKQVRFRKLNFNHEKKVDDFVKENKEMFDIVMGIEVIEHVENPWSYIQKLSGMACSEGLIILTTPNITSWLSRIKFLIFGEFASFSNNDFNTSGHINPISAWEMRIIMSNLALKDIRIEPAGYLPKMILGRSWKMHAINLLHILLRPLMRGLKDGWCILASARK